MSLLALRQTELMCADQVASEEKVNPRYLNCLTMCKMASLTNRGDGGRVGIDFLENSR